MESERDKIGMMGFSAGAELTGRRSRPVRRLRREPDGSLHPDVAGIIYPGPSPFAHGRIPPPVQNVPPASSAAYRRSRSRRLGYRVLQRHACPWSAKRHLHVSGNGRHPGDPLPDGTHMTGGLTDRGGIPFGTWQFRFIDWFRDLGFLRRPGWKPKRRKMSPRT